MTGTAAELRQQARTARVRPSDDSLRPQSARSLRARRVGGLAGMIGPLLFIATFTLEGWLRPGYDPVGAMISYLSLGPRGWIQAANFALLGVCLLLYVRGLREELERPSPVRLILLALIAFAFLPSALFPIDPPLTPPAQATLVGLIHTAAGVVIFVGSTITMLLFALHWWRAPHWRSWRLPTVLVAAWMALILPAFVMSQDPASLQSVYTGGLQRAIIVPFLLWNVAMAARMWRGAR